MTNFNSLFFLAFLVATASCQIYEKDDATKPSGWFSGIFHGSGDKSVTSLPESEGWSTEAPSSTPSSLWSYLSFGHHTTPSSILRLRRAAQGQYGYRPYRPYNRYPNQAYNRGWNQGGSQQSYYQRPVETTTQARSIYMPGNGPDMPVASSTYPPQFGYGVTYKNGATVKPTTSTANPAAAWYQNWLNSLPDSLKALYGVTTTVPPQGLVGRRRRRRAVEDLASTEGRLSYALDKSTESSISTEDSSTETLRETTTKAIPRIRRAVDISSTSQSPLAMIAIEGQEKSTTASSQTRLPTSTPALR